MSTALDISSIDDKIAWTATSTLMLVVRRPNGNRALLVHCSQVGSKWMVTKSVVVSGGFEIIKGAVANQELIDTFDDLQEALGAGATVARKWLADPDAASTAADPDQQVIANHAGQLTCINTQMLESAIRTLGQQISTLTAENAMLCRELEEARSAAAK